jgi:hypothetical protein
MHVFADGDKRASAANPKFARPGGKGLANFGFKSGTRLIKLLVSL